MAESKEKSEIQTLYETLTPKNKEYSLTILRTLVQGEKSVKETYGIESIMSQQTIHSRSLQ